MREKDSTRTRICPAFWIIERHPKPFFALLARRLGFAFDPSRVNIEEIQFADSKTGTGKEISFGPNPEYLKWLLDNPMETEIERKLAGKELLCESDKQRLKLVSRNKEIAEAAHNRGLQGIAECGNTCNQCRGRKSHYGKKWFVLEGATKPDVFIRTNKFYLIIEGKRTEHRPETHTKWKRDRHQIVRHLEGLQLYVKNEKSKLQSYGIFIVEKEDKENFNIYNTMRPFDQSLPHIVHEDERVAIKNMFKGCLTWDEVQEAYHGEIQYPNSISQGQE